MNETVDFPRPPGPVESGADDPRLLAALREFQAALDTGRRPTREEFLARHPEIAAELAECLDGLDVMHAAAPRLGPPESAAAPAGLSGVLGDFRLLREVGRGGMGVVYEAEQLSLGRRVALKVLPLAATLDPRQRQRFENEARAAAHLHHPNIVPVFAVGSERGVHYYAMQFIDGRTLAEVIDHLRQAPQPAAPAADTAENAASVTQQSVGSRTFIRTVAALGVQAAEALEYAHQMGVVHRDVKPANLMLDGRGTLWVTDFGLARFQAAPQVTAPGDLVGTLRYMSPEQAAGSPVIDPRSDVYALGATLYELLTQQPAVAGRDRRECLRQILDDEPTPPRRLNRALPPELEIIVLKALAKHPDERYGSARELADDLRRFLDDQPIRARRPTLWDWAAKWARRHRRLVAAAVLLLAAAVLVLGATTWRVALAESQTRTAYEALKQEQTRTQAALEGEAAQRSRAEGNYREARDVLAFLSRLGVEELAGKREMKELRQRLLNKLLDYYQALIDRHGDDPSVTTELVEAQFEAAELLDELGRQPEALAAFQKGERLCERLEGGPKPPHGGPPRGVAAVMLLAQPAVQQDLKLSAREAERLTNLLSFERTPPTPEGFAAAEKALARVLKPEQAERLRQITLQSRGAQALLDPDTAAALGLTDQQKDEIRSALARAEGDPGRQDGPDGPGRRPGPDGPGWRDGPRGPGGRDGKGGPGRRDGPRGPKDGGRGPDEAGRDQVNEKVLKVLTPEQRVLWQKMLGEPFRGELRFGPPRPEAPPRGR